MCARFKLTIGQAELAELFDIAIDVPVEPRPDIRPTDPALIITHNFHARPMQWGFLPAWARAVTDQRYINARSESAFEKPAFRAAWRARRCIVPATSYIEWKDEAAEEEQGSLFGDAQTKVVKQKYEFSLVDCVAFGMPGLYESWQSPDGSTLETFAVLTTRPNAFAATFHDRMPCMLRADDFENWLDPSIQSLEMLCAMLEPIDASQLQAVKI